MTTLLFSPSNRGEDAKLPIMLMGKLGAAFPLASCKISLPLLSKITTYSVPF